MIQALTTVSAARLRLHHQHVCHQYFCITRTLTSPVRMSPVCLGMLASLKYKATQAAAALRTLQVMHAFVSPGAARALGVALLTRHPFPLKVTSLPRRKLACRHASVLLCSHACMHAFMGMRGVRGKVSTKASFRPTQPQNILTRGVHCACHAWRRVWWPLKSQVSTVHSFMKVLFATLFVDQLSKGAVSGYISYMHQKCVVARCNHSKCGGSQTEHTLLA